LLLAALMGGFCAWMGLSLSWTANLPAGPSIVLTASGIFFISVFLARAADWSSAGVN
jgi:zinc/manganese transport system permease protein